MSLPELISEAAAATPALNGAIFVLSRGVAPEHWQQGGSRNAFPAYVVPPPIESAERSLVDRSLGDLSLTDMPSVSGVMSALPTRETYQPTVVEDFDTAVELLGSPQPEALHYGLVVLRLPTGVFRAYLMTDADGVSEMLPLKCLTGSYDAGGFSWRRAGEPVIARTEVQSYFAGRIDPDGKQRYTVEPAAGLGDLLRAFGTNWC